MIHYRAIGIRSDTAEKEEPGDGWRGGVIFHFFVVVFVALGTVLVCPTLI